VGGVLAHKICGGSANEENRYAAHEDNHPDAPASQTLLAGGEIILAAVIAVVPTPEAAAMRDLAWSAAPQLGLPFDLNVLASNRHNKLDCLLTRCGWPEHSA
jgi:hypothetical protein